MQPLYDCTVQIIFFRCSVNEKSPRPYKRLTASSPIAALQLIKDEWGNMYSDGVTKLIQKPRRLLFYNKTRAYKNVAKVVLPKQVSDGLAHKIAVELRRILKETK
jgi:hypothetical protein